MAERLLFEVLVIVVASFAVVTALVRLRFSPVTGYLLTGVLVGPHGFGLLPATEGIRFLGELGVVLLMFIIGLEFSLPRMLAARAVVFGLGSLQVALTTLAGGVLAWLIGIGLVGSLLIGGAIAMSSTAIAAKQLTDQQELNTQHGRLALGILLFQDLATLPFLILTDALSGQGEASPAFAAGRAALAVVLFLAIALLVRRTLGRMFEALARTRSAEVFLLGILSLVLLAAFGAEELGLSLPIGAFLVGMIIGESDFRHQVEDEIRPFRDVLLGLFFLTVGMAVDPRTILTHPLFVVAALASLVALKAAIVFGVAWVMGWSASSAFRGGLILAHSGEFALLLITQALAAALVPADMGQVVLVTVVLSMALAPLLIQWNGILAQLPGLGSSQPASQPDEAVVAEASDSLSGHVILGGCGRVGCLVAKVLDIGGIPYVAIEHDIDRLRQARARGHHVVFGDATRAAILHAAGLERAKVIVTTLDSLSGSERLVHRVRHMGITIPIIVRTHDMASAKGLAETGATHVLPDSLAAGLGLSDHLLRVLGVAPQEIVDRIEHVRSVPDPAGNDGPGSAPDERRIESQRQ
jgi:CPA2 family monovalent cation:H+ antiporter-2